MAARGQEDQLSLGGDPAVDRIIGCGIAGVQSDHHIDALQRDVRNFTDLKSKVSEIRIGRRPGYKDPPTQDVFRRRRPRRGTLPD